MFQRVVTMKENERHHLKGRIAKMEVVLNLYVSKKVTHEDHARGAWYAHGGELSRANHKNGCREKVILT